MDKDANGRSITVRYISDGKEPFRDEELDATKVTKIRFVISDEPEDYVDVSFDWQGDKVVEVAGARPISIMPTASNRVLISTSWERVGKH